jgi:starch synthase
MRILIASPEAVPYVKTGGLADVAGALVKEFRKMRHDAILVLPLYRAIRDRTQLADSGISMHIPVGDRFVNARILSDKRAAYFVECDEFFDRPELYGTAQGDYSDNAARFSFFSKSVLEMCRKLNYRPDIIHCNDWQTGLIPLYLKTIYKDEALFSKTATFMTIHNLGYQGLFPVSDMPLTNLGWEMFTTEGIEFYGKVNFLKAGLIAADVVSTVSETYSREILLPESGVGLDGVLKRRERSLHGIINGIDYGEWDPSADKFLPAHYTQKDLSGKALCKRDLLSTVFHTGKRRRQDRAPLLGMVTRLSEQKGLDLIVQAIPEIVAFGVRLVILGKGDERFHKIFSDAAEEYPENISVTIGFDEVLAHRIYAGSDFFLMPSHYEPCGLGQLIALRYGSIPIVRKTGGLADTVQDFEPLTNKGTGFLFSDFSVTGMLDALKRALCVYTDAEKMQIMVRRGMQADFSWKRSAQRYAEIYKATLREGKV